MAFRQPAFHAPQRIFTAPNETQAQAQTSPQQTQPLEESQEWILFSPTAASTTDRTYTTSTGRTRTVGRSRISDLGSLDTRAGYEEGYSEDAIEEEEEEDGELDSLDSHLHEFRSEPSVWREHSEREIEKSGTVLPTHDGLGGFRMTENVVQEHLYAFERFNPRRIKRRREGEGIEDETERAAEVERTRRVEEWRMEQSRLLVDEIQKETRRRKLSITSERRSLVEEREHEDVVTMSNVDGSVEDLPSDENESFWNRITRRVIRDLMGIDDDLLSIIFGETLPEGNDLSSTPQATSPFDAAHSLIAKNQQYDQSSWEYRLLERIARELGILVNQLTDHPGAFNTYLQSATTPLPYAGLPVIPESGNTQLLPDPQASSQAPDFQPTLQTQPLSIPQTNTSFSAALSPEDATPRASAPISREEWERDLDIKMVFRYLRTRFVSKFSSTAPSSSPFTPSQLATASTADTAARAARVRQHHPLVHERRERQRPRTWRVSVPGSEKAGPLRRRGSSSCASEHLSALNAGGMKSGSSRHYWDFGPGSVGTRSAGGSLVLSAGGMGSWGEV